MGRKRGKLDDLLFSAAVALVPLVLRLWARTWSIRVLNRHGLSFIDPGRPVIGVLWHQIIIPGITFFRDRQGTVMASRSRDGELIARFSSRLGFSSVRGSSSRGGAEALLEATRRIRGGAQMAIVADGPRGPARDPKMGCVMMSRNSGAPIIAMACRAKPALFGRNWDRTMLPLPFARMVMSFGDPIYVPSDASAEECEKYRLQVRDAINAAEEAAERAVGKRSRKAE